METAARETWRAALEAWAIPQRLIDAVGVDPARWDHPRWSGERRAATQAPTPTRERVAEVSAGGSVLDIGSGLDRIALELGGSGHRVTAVERDPEVARLLSSEAERFGVRLTVLVGAWPVVAGNTGVHDVTVATHTVYEVSGIGPYLAAMHERARRGVVLELTPRHPWATLSRYFRRLHALERPTRPNVDDLLRVVMEVTGARPQQERWSAPNPLRFADRQELIAFYLRRLLVPPSRSLEAAALLEREVRRGDDGWLVLGSDNRDVATVWWTK